MTEDKPQVEKAKPPKPNQPMSSSALFEAADNRLTITHELLPVSELAHHQIVALFGDKDDPPKVSVDFKDDKGRLMVVVTFQHDKNIAVEGKVQHDIHKAAADKGMAVPEYLKWKAAEDKKAAAAKAAADKAAKAAAKE